MAIGTTLFAFRPRTWSSKVLALGAFISLVLVLYAYSTSESTFRFPDWSSAFAGRQRSSCSPEDWSHGRWVYSPRTNLTSITGAHDALAMAGLEGCAADREYAWHLGTDHPEEWGRFPSVNSYEWVPSSRCDISPLNGTSIVKDMVQKGGWLLLGDSIAENHFFSLSCLLYPHVRATPNYTENPYFDRAWVQNIYLSPTSPLLDEIDLPTGFSVESTPLVTFYRVDLLFNKEDLDNIYRRTLMPADTFGPEIEADLANKTLFSKEQTWSMSPSEYMPKLLGDLPDFHYGTLVVSTAGHWTTTLMSAFRDEEAGEEAGYGIANVKSFFEIAMREWAREVQTAINEYRAKGGWRPKQVVVRAYLPGHEDCHNHHEPWTEIEPYRWRWYNWPWIQDFNKIFKALLASSEYPDIFFLQIDRPGRLRPDAHASGDCLHLLTGPGVIEGWSHYIWHFVSREIPGRIR
ncbi:hypothetical protein PISMIDRAFT_677882 [Pisolithus microcarpus 441]|uniref:Uncharacterized protein n=1 Tax=Pisolithus microcarpus 441 TaxID=765257 RepID=A0A0C9ZYH7_9AGAM|nr:hypothetical protein PISMIDRAFT_677882 [Pisolithus microcarpus 441]